MSLRHWAGFFYTQVLIVARKGERTWFYNRFIISVAAAHRLSTVFNPPHEPKYRITKCVKRKEPNREQPE